MNLIKIDNLSKIYRLYNKPQDRLREVISFKNKKLHNDFHALNDVSLSAAKGETLGIIGQNGSGKSTLLKIICGVLRPTSGSIHVNGRIAALLELGAGFNSEFTGRENVYMSGALMGFSREEMNQSFPYIESFAEIGEFIDQPVKTYSSGMYVRLAFSIAIHSKPDIFIIDEALSVGDARFQQKCIARIKKFCEERTVIFVSHDMSAVKELCSKLYWLDSGKIKMVGAPLEVCEKYLEFMYNNTYHKVENRGEIETADARERFKVEGFTTVDQGLRQFGDKRALIGGVRFLSLGSNSNVAYSDESAEIGLVLTTHDMISRPIVGYICKDRIGRPVVGDNSEHLGIKIPPLEKSRTYIFYFRIKNWPNLYEGEYTITIAIADGDLHDHNQCHWIHDALVIKSVPVRMPGGMLSIVDTDLEFVEVQ